MVTRRRSDIASMTQEADPYEQLYRAMYGLDPDASTADRIAAGGVVSYSQFRNDMVDLRQAVEEAGGADAYLQQEGSEASSIELVIRAADQIHRGDGLDQDALEADAEAWQEVSDEFDEFRREHFYSNRGGFGFLDEVREGLGDTVTPVVGTAADAAGAVIEGAADITGSVMEGMAEPIEDASEAMAPVIEGLREEVASLVPTEEISEAVTEAWDAGIGAVDDALGDIGDALDEAWDWTQDRVRDLEEWAEETFGGPDIPGAGSGGDGSGSAGDPAAAANVQRVDAFLTGYRPNTVTPASRGYLGQRQGERRRADTDAPFRGYGELPQIASLYPDGPPSLIQDDDDDKTPVLVERPGVDPGFAAERSDQVATKSGRMVVRTGVDPGFSADRIGEDPARTRTRTRARFGRLNAPRRSLI
ncbi:MAG: hypothetical protein ACOC00_00195 [Halothiobacillaceae bacterium]